MEKIKLYTEEQVKVFVREHTFIPEKIVKGMISNHITPIELPSDEEIIDNSPRSYSHGELIAYIVGAKWVIEQIKQQADGKED